jgi:hypothetical protein
MLGTPVNDPRRGKPLSMADAHTDQLTPRVMLEERMRAKDAGLSGNVISTSRLLTE